MHGRDHFASIVVPVRSRMQERGNSASILIAHQRGACDLEFCECTFCAVRGQG